MEEASPDSCSHSAPLPRGRPGEDYRSLREERRLGELASDDDVESRVKWLNPAAYRVGEMVVVRRSTEEWRYAEVLSVAQDGVQLRVGPGLTKDVATRLLGTHLGKIPSMPGAFSGPSSSRSLAGGRAKDRSGRNGPVEQSSRSVQWQSRRGGESSSTQGQAANDSPLGSAVGSSSASSSPSSSSALLQDLQAEPPHQQEAQAALTASASIRDAVDLDRIGDEADTRGIRLESEAEAAADEEADCAAAAAAETKLPAAAGQHEDCPICLEPLGKGRAMFASECGHLCHFWCICENVRHGNMCCPLCRHTLLEKPTFLSSPLHASSTPPLSLPPSEPTAADMAPDVALRIHNVVLGAADGPSRTVDVAVGPDPSARVDVLQQQRRDWQRARNHIAEQRAVALELMAAAEERIAMVRAAHAEVHSHVRLAQQLVQRIADRRQRAVGDGTRQHAAAAGGDGLHAVASSSAATSAGLRAPPQIAASRRTILSSDAVAAAAAGGAGEAAGSGVSSAASLPLMPRSVTQTSGSSSAGGLALSTAQQQQQQQQLLVSSSLSNPCRNRRETRRQQHQQQQQVQQGTRQLAAREALVGVGGSLVNLGDLLVDVGASLSASSGHGEQVHEQFLEHTSSNGQQQQQQRRRQQQLPVQGPSLPSLSPVSVSFQGFTGMLQQEEEAEEEVELEQQVQLGEVGLGQVEVGQVHDDGLLLERQPSAVEVLQIGGGVHRIGSVNSLAGRLDAQGGESEEETGLQVAESGGRARAISGQQQQQQQQQADGQLNATACNRQGSSGSGSETESVESENPTAEILSLPLEASSSPDAIISALPIAMGPVPSLQLPPATAAPPPAAASAAAGTQGATNFRGFAANLQLQEQSRAPGQGYHHRHEQHHHQQQGGRRRALVNLRVHHQSGGSSMVQGMASSVRGAASGSRFLPPQQHEEQISSITIDVTEEDLESEETSPEVGLMPGLSQRLQSLASAAAVTPEEEEVLYSLESAIDFNVRMITSSTARVGWHNCEFCTDPNLTMVDAAGYILPHRMQRDFDSASVVFNQLEEGIVQVIVDFSWPLLRLVFIHHFPQHDIRAMVLRETEARVNQWLKDNYDVPFVRQMACDRRI